MLVLNDVNVAPQSKSVLLVTFKIDLLCQFTMNCVPPFAGGIEIQLNFHCDVISDQMISTLFHLYPQTCTHNV